MSFSYSHVAALTCVTSLSLPAVGADTAAEKDWELSLRLGPEIRQDSVTGFPNQDRPPYRFEYDTGLAWSVAGVSAALRSCTAGSAVLPSSCWDAVRCRWWPVRGVRVRCCRQISPNLRGAGSWPACEDRSRGRD